MNFEWVKLYENDKALAAPPVGAAKALLKVLDRFPEQVLAVLS